MDKVYVADTQHEYTVVEDNNICKKSYQRGGNL